jgi:hypothetical protein
MDKRKPVKNLGHCTLKWTRNLKTLWFFSLLHFELDFKKFKRKTRNKNTQIFSAKRQVGVFIVCTELHVHKYMYCTLQCLLHNSLCDRSSSNKNILGKQAKSNYDVASELRGRGGGEGRGEGGVIFHKI